MFAWLKSVWNWCKSWFVDVEKYDLYTISERKIYTYHDGTKKVKADPMILYKNLMDMWGDLSGDLKVAISPMKDADACLLKALDKIYKIFNVKAYDGTEGLTAGECIDLLNHFICYCNEIKKKLKSSPTSPKGTSQDTKPSQEDSHPTEKPLASGSTADVPSTGEQDQSPLVLQ